MLWGSFERGDVRINPERKIEMLGRPDMALEVVSKTSERKDLQELVHDYARAGVREYWTADARGDERLLRIGHWDHAGIFLAVAPDAEGWCESRIWGEQFRLKRFTDRAGQLDYELEVRAT